MMIMRERGVDYINQNTTNDNIYAGTPQAINYFAELETQLMAEGVLTKDYHTRTKPMVLWKYFEN